MPPHQQQSSEQGTKPGQQPGHSSTQRAQPHSCTPGVTPAGQNTIPKPEHGTYTQTTALGEMHHRTSGGFV